MGDPFDIELWSVDDDAMLASFLELLQTTFPHGRFSEEWFLWKHRHGALGPSIVTYATSAGEPHPVAMRAFWRHRISGRDGPRLAFQPCDTATHPGFRRRGLFSQLTTLAIAEANRQGAELLFNFPNKMSKPGYLKLGWCEAGGMEALLQPLRPLRLLAAMAKGRGKMAPFQGELRDSCPPQGHTLVPKTVTMPAPTGSRVQSIPAEGWAQWRFGRHPLHRYRWVGDLRHGAVVHLGHRGPLVDARLAEVFLPNRFPVSWLLRLGARIRHELGADMVTTYLCCDHPGYGRLRLAGFIPVPSQTQLVARCVSSASCSHEIWGLSAADMDIV